ncbi:MAG: AI-2E family transporter [Clostridia bacterium]|nr:AI-2E family transporter [Clostridia bacterium]
MFKKFKENKYFRYGAIAFIVGALLVGLIFAIIKFSDITSVISGIVDAMSAFVYGFVFAFLINPLYKKYHKHVFKFVEKKKEHHKLRKAFSLILAYITIAAIIALFIWLVVPNIVDNVKTLAEKFPAYVQSIKASLLDILSKIPGVEDPNVTLQQITDYFSSDSATSDIAGMLGSVATTIIHIVITIGSHAFSIIVGIILSIYFLIYKESIIRRTKRLLCAIFKQKNYERIMDFANYTNNTFARYIVGAILDSILVGIVIGLVLWACGFPFAALIGVICGVTNIIPFFGPFIGSIPSAVLILIATGDIWKVVLFALIILIIQQIDGNLIAPHIHGASTGLTPIGVIAATTLCSHLFGFVGMVIGVPLCAVVCYIFSRIINKRLRKKNMPIDEGHYASPDIYKDIPTGADDNPSSGAKS